jgi:hypothetical protein
VEEFEIFYFFKFDILEFFTIREWYHTSVSKARYGVLALIAGMGRSILDAKATQAVEELTRELVRRYTIIIVTHNMAQARRISDSVILLGSFFSCKVYG